jgi:hypothetical protein
MAKEPRIKTVSPGSELAALLDEASSGLLLLEKDGVIYIPDPQEQDIWAGYDPEAVRAGIHSSAGSLSKIEADALIAAIYKAREVGSRPPGRPSIDVLYS